MPNPSRRAIVGVLRKHGLLHTVAEAARDVGAKVRQRTIEEAKECGAFVDADTGAQVGPIISGSSDRLELGPLLRIMEPGRRYVCVHSHPEDDSFSPHDIALVLRFGAVCLIAAVGRRGTWYVASVAPEYASASLEAMEAAFTAERAAVAPTYAGLVQSGEMTRREAQSAATHEVWQRIAPALGLRYDRVIG